MMIRCAFLLALLYATPSLAKCHHYSIWQNPWPQSCGTTEKAAAESLRGRPAAADATQLAENPPAPPEKPKDFLPPFTVSPHNTIILRPDPKRTDEEGRAQAIEILKQVMGQ